MSGVGTSASREALPQSAFRLLNHHHQLPFPHTHHASAFPAEEGAVAAFWHSKVNLPLSALTSRTHTDSSPSCSTFGPGPC